MNNFKKMSYKTAFILLIIIFTLAIFYRNISLNAKLEKARANSSQEDISPTLAPVSLTTLSAESQKILYTSNGGVKINWDETEDAYGSDTIDPTVAPAFEKLLANNKSKKIIINYWAPWNLPSQEMLDELQKAANTTTADFSKVAIICINVSPSKDINADNTFNKGYPFTFVKDSVGVLMRKFQIDSIPSTVFLESTQKSSFILRGKMSSDEIIKNISELK